MEYDISNKINLHSHESQLLNRTLSKSAITLLKNNEMIPIFGLDTLKIAYLSMGSASGDYFYQRLNNYLPVDKYVYEQKSTKGTEELVDKISNYDIVVVGLHYPNNNFWEKHSFSENENLLIQEISASSKVILSVFGHPRIINKVSDSNLDGLILSYQNSFDFQDLTAQLIFGSIGANGLLPLSLDNFSCGEGLIIDAFRDFGFILPLEAGLEIDSLKKIDFIVSDAITNKVMPGCQIVISRYGKVLYNKSYGFHTYDSLLRVEDDHLYDIASITKIAAAAPILMSLFERREINLNRKLKKYSSLFASSNKRNLKILDILTHQAGLLPWIPFYKNTLTKDGDLIDSLYSVQYSEQYPLEVAKDIYISPSYIDNVFSEILTSSLLTNKEYKYSDLGFYLLKPILEEKINSKIDKYLTLNLYHKIETYRITYNPLKKFDTLLIVPTENDNYFRKQLLKGHVHDQGAALFGGIGLHAGLFSNGLDLMKLMQLYLDQGSYLDTQLYSKKTIKKFTNSPFLKSGNRRALIFDKPSVNIDENGPSCQGISSLSYGHSGFTGTLLWGDPSTGIVYVFLSNARVYPDGNNTDLIKQNIRTDIQKIIYESIIN